MNEVVELKPKTLGFVEPHEEAAARNLIDVDFLTMCGKSLQFKAAGYMLLCKIYIRPEEIKKIKNAEGKEVTLWRPPTSVADDKYQSCTALVCDVGPLAFKDRETGKYWASGPTARVGDFVVIPRFESAIVMYRGVAMALIPDDRIYGTVSEPGDITAAALADKI